SAHRRNRHGRNSRGDRTRGERLAGATRRSGGTGRWGCPTFDGFGVGPAPGRACPVGRRPAFFGARRRRAVCVMVRIADRAIARESTGGAGLDHRRPIGGSAGPQGTTVSVLGYPIRNVNASELIDLLIDRAADRRSTTVEYLNANSYNLASRNRAFRRALLAAD